VFVLRQRGNSKLNAVPQKDYPTDVLSSPGRVARAAFRGRHYLVGKGQRTGQTRRRTLDEELVTLLIHGIVHLLGYDHERSPKDARLMDRLEKKIYRALCDRGILKV
jgi:rRNA maturation RNase YbeY